MKEIDFKKLKEFDNHKLVIKIEDKDAGLKGFIAIHNDKLGSPAVGGTRMLPYKSEKDALADVLKLSRAMTYKCAMAKVPYGGAKGVIIGDSKKDKTEKLLKAYAQKINSLKGQFYTGEDVGISQNDVNIMLKASSYFIGKPNLAGDPSPYAALSVFYSIQSAVYCLYKTKSLKDIKIAIKGVGKVGGELVRLLYNTGAIVYVSDIDKISLAKIKIKFPKVKIVDNKKIHTLAVDVYSPCALGDEFSTKNAKKIMAKIICGGANNQLADDKVGDWFFKHNIVYIPDYVANSGGLIDVVDELAEDGYKKNRVLEKINDVKNTVKKILKLSLKNNKSPHRVADEIAESYFNN
ncbi:MAG: Glu/Leu/Phe/Val dehydrogenase [Candidatus Staskawiczbacteria bacterium]|nr:Glu/Leu/Phe/Val dehydrogenase [Candidatus Staskawiczbacteria bacterium]